MDATPHRQILFGKVLDGCVIAQAPPSNDGVSIVESIQTRQGEPNSRRKYCLLVNTKRRKIASQLVSPKLRYSLRAKLWDTTV